jgi:hypothetical protein
MTPDSQYKVNQLSSSGFGLLNGTGFFDLAFASGCGARLRLGLGRSFARGFGQITTTSLTNMWSPPVVWGGKITGVKL